MAGRRADTQLNTQASRGCIHPGTGMTRADMWPGNGVHRTESLQRPHGTNTGTEVFPPGIYLHIHTISLSLPYHGRKGVTVGLLGQSSALLFTRVTVTSSLPGTQNPTTHVLGCTESTVPVPKMSLFVAPP